MQKFDNSYISSFLLSFLLSFMVVWYVILKMRLDVFNGLYYSLMEICRNFEFSMPFLKEEVAYTKDIFFGKQSCIFCKKYFNYLMGKRMRKQKEYSNYFKQLKTLFKNCFQLLVCSWNLIFLQTNQVRVGEGLQNAFFQEMLHNPQLLRPHPLLAL